MAAQGTWYWADERTGAMMRVVIEKHLTKRKAQYEKHPAY
jgi:hypothetical protein